MEKLIAHIDQKSFLEAEKYIDQISEEANVMRETMLQDAKEKIEKRKLQYKLELNRHKEESLTRIKMNARNQTNQLKQELVNVVIDDVKSYFKNLTIEGYLAFLDKAIERHAKDKGKPRLIVCSRYYEGVLQKYGLEYQVLRDEELKSGFIFSYQSYDINFEVNQIFQFHHQEFQRMIITGLFYNHEKK